MPIPLIPIALKVLPWISKALGFLKKKKAPPEPVKPPPEKPAAPSVPIYVYVGGALFFVILVFVIIMAVKK